MYSMALGPRFFKWKMLSLSRPKALLFLQLLIALLTRSVVNVCAISKDFLFVSLVTNRVSLEEVCLPSFDVLNCWLNLVASCLDDENEIPLKIIASFSASRFALPSIPFYSDYSPFSDRVGLPLHNIHIPSPFTSIMDIFFCRSHVRPYPLQHSLTMSFLVFQPVFCLQLYTSYISSHSPHHMSIPSQSTTSNEGCDGSTPTSLFNSSFVLLSFNEIPHIHLIISISALSNFNLTSTSNGLVSLP